MTLVGLAVIAGCIAFWVLTTWPSGIGTYVFGGVFALVGVALLFWARASSAQAKCPGCSLPIRGLAAGTNEPLLCRSCVEFVEGTGGELWLVEPDRVTASPRFAAPCPDERAVFPAVCAVCGAAPTRTVTALWTEETDAPLGRDLATRAVSLGTVRAVTEITHSVEVPHCQAHSNGADLRRSFGGGGSEVVFRSLAYLRAFCKANKVTPVP